MTVFFYELHEGDDVIFSDILVASEEEVSADIFFEIVQSIRRRVQDTFEQDTLIEAIADELEREHGFIFISDRRLTAAVNVSTIEEDNSLADLDGTYGDLDADEDADFETLVAEFRGDTPERRS